MVASCGTLMFMLMFLLMLMLLSDLSISAGMEGRTMMVRSFWNVGDVLVGADSIAFSLFVWMVVPSSPTEKAAASSVSAREAKRSTAPRQGHGILDDRCPLDDINGATLPRL